MSIIKVQINHNKNLTKEELSSHFYDEIGEEYDIPDYEVEDFLNIHNTFQLPNESFITIFTLDFPDLPTRDLEPKDIIKSYLDTLNSLEKVISLVKLQDEVLQEIALKYYKRLFDIEMELRNVLSYILTYDDKPIETDTFKSFGIDKAQTFSSDEIYKKYENGLFYILFNHYGSFTEPKLLKAEKIAELLQDISIKNYAEFKNRIQKRYIKCERHSEFLYSIKQKLDPLEKMRNAVMHVRNLSETLIKNFENSINDGHHGYGVSTLIDEFWLKENNHLKETTWMELAKRELLNFDIQELLADNENDLDNEDDVIDYITEEVTNIVDVSGYEPTEEQLNALNDKIATSF